ncbi:hypothetical protein J2785_005424 [Burkholderia ambifaria]|nr:hypothetical protein [Burkholderia ambifaria]MDR6502244.1 hypothetical protein [Burkholderia ambifaria]
MNTKTMKICDTVFDHFTIQINMAVRCRRVFVLIFRTGGKAISGVGPVEGAVFALLSDQAAHELA